MTDWKQRFTKQFTDNVIEGSSANDLRVDQEDTQRLMTFVAKELTQARKDERQKVLELLEAVECEFSADVGIWNVDIATGFDAGFEKLRAKLRQQIKEMK